MPRPVSRPLLPTLAVAGLVAGLVGTAPGTAMAAAAPAPGGPGAMSHFGLARKDCVGTARNTTSKVWFTVANGVLSDVYYPTIDTTNVETLQLLVTDGSTFTDLQTRDMTYTVRALDRSGMACRVTSTARSGRYRLTTDYFTDPHRNSVVMRVRLAASRGDAGKLRVFARHDATVNGNGGGGDPATANAGADDAVTDTSTRTPVPVSLDTNTRTTAANRDYAVPVYSALRADRPFLAVSNGFAGTASDGLAQLDADHRLATAYASASGGNVVQTAQLDLGRSGSATLALGFGTTQPEAVRTAGRTASAEPGDLLEKYQAGWTRYDKGLRAPALPRQLTPSERREVHSTYWTSANVLKASEDKTFPGAVVASLASPWGQAVAAGDPAQSFFGSYREVFARDLYESFTGLLAAGDLATATATVRFLFERQQQPDGSMPRNSLVNGKTAPDSFGVQLDEVAYPILMARTVGLTDPAFYTHHIKRAADFVVAHGPSFGNERWEEQSGFSPSTIAAEIAGLAAAGAIAELNGDAAGARIYRATADHYQRNVKAWTVTSNGPLSTQPYFIRLSKNADPNSAFGYNLANGGPDADQRSVVDQGFLELPRLGILPAGDADVANSLTVADAVIRRTTSSGDGFYRYGTTSPGTEDGYGDCNVPDSTSCTVQGKPWAGVCDTQEQNKGSGHLWPVLAGERAEHEIATGDPARAARLWLGMARTASGVGLVPEQFWENDDLAASPFGTQPECASIGFTNGKAVGSASPLTWSAAQFVRLARNLAAGRVTETPFDTTARYLDRTQTGTTVDLTSPADGASVDGTTTVAGTTAPNATVDVDAVNTDIDGAATVTTTTADAAGAFSVDVTVPAGTAVLTVTATAPDGSTGLAQRTVVFDVVPGTLLFEATDPDGDDNGPGTYAYPLSNNFQPGAYDLQRFQVYDSGPDTVTFRVQTRDLTQTFGSPLGAQLVDVYVRDPASVAGGTSTAASFPQRNYTIDPGDAWTRLLEVQGFGQRFVDASGATVGSVQIRGAAVTRFITFTVSKAALGGTPGSGWSFAVVLTGQDGFSPDQARGFKTLAEDFQFGVCTPAAVAAQSPICTVDPATVPKAMDVITPAGVDQATELDPRAPVVIRGVTIP
jgi:glucan 1,4-alpha-glucosidase